MQIEDRIGLNEGIFWGLLLGVGGNAIITLLTKYITEPIQSIVLVLFSFLSIYVAGRYLADTQKLNDRREGIENKKNAEDLTNFPHVFPLYRKTPRKDFLRFIEPFETEIVWLDRKTGQVVSPPESQWMKIIRKYNGI